MKLTPAQLRRIIKEEIASTLREDFVPEGGPNPAETLGALAGAIVYEIESHLSGDTAYSNIGEYTAGSVGAVTVGPYTKPGEQEAAAKMVVDEALEMLRPVLEKLAAEMLDTLQENHPSR